MARGGCDYVLLDLVANLAVSTSLRQYRVEAVLIIRLTAGRWTDSPRDQSGSHRFLMGYHPSDRQTFNHRCQPLQSTSSA